jgi:hypothetical protein
VVASSYPVGKRPIVELMVHDLPLDQAVEAYEKFDARQDGYTKVLLHPGTDACRLTRRLRHGNAPMARLRGGEGAADLHRTDRQGLQLPQARVAGPEVVDGDADSARPLRYSTPLMRSTRSPRHRSTGW